MSERKRQRRGEVYLQPGLGYDILEARNKPVHGDDPVDAIGSFPKELLVAFVIAIHGAESVPYSRHYCSEEMTVRILQ